MNLLSSAGTQALQSFQSSSDYSALKGIKTENTATGAMCGFDTGSIFANQSGIADSCSSPYGSSMGGFYQGNTTGLENYWSLGNDGLNRNGAVSHYISNRLPSIPTSVRDYVKGDFGCSLAGNYCTSLQSTALGQYAPTSVFEQRLNYHLDFADQNKPGQLKGNYSNYFNTESVAYNQTASSNYNVFGTSPATSASAATKSQSSAASGDLSGYQKAASAQSVSSLMSLLA